jgi:hypothetical protein
MGDAYRTPSSTSRSGGTRPGGSRARCRRDEPAPLHARPRPRPASSRRGCRRGRRGAARRCPAPAARRAPAPAPPTGRGTGTAPGRTPPRSTSPPPPSTPPPPSPILARNGRCSNVCSTWWMDGCARNGDRSVSVRVRADGNRRRPIDILGACGGKEKELKG